MLNRLKRVSWITVVPLLAIVVLAVIWGEALGPALVVLAAALLV
ncbi:MAG: hypothetical protein QOC58_2735, partial [Mycobacterium sp.]|nr:hypothetical protein [Mycobacterium sp.]